MPYDNGVKFSEEKGGRSPLPARWPSAVTAGFLIAIALAACGSDPVTKLTPAEIAELPKFTIEPRHGPTPRRLVSHDIRIGSGAVMEPGDAMVVAWAEVEYGKGLTTGIGEGQPQSLTFDGVLTGWEMGMPGMRVGGRRELIVPPRLGDLPVTMVYQIDLLGIERPSQEQDDHHYSSAGESAPSGAPPIEVPTGPPPSHVVIRDRVIGKGPAIPPMTRKPRVEISTMYETAIYRTGTVVDDRWAIGNPFDTKFQPGLVVPAWEKGVVGMRPGGVRELIVPSNMAYHSGARIFVVKLLSVKRIGGGSQAANAPGTYKKLTKSRGRGGNEHVLTIPRQSGPPPRHVEVVDLRKGTGAQLRKRDAATVRYFDVSYPEARAHSRSGVYGPHTFTLDETVKGWTVGLPGMRVGGRRELILPPRFVYPRWRPSWGYAPYADVYVVELIGVRRR